MSDPSRSRRWLSYGTPSALGSFFQSISLARRLLLYHITCFFLSHPYPLRVLFAVLRRVRPIAVVGNTVLVAKASDVREVLERFDDFTLAEVLGSRMPWGPFLLSLDWREQHARERQLLESVVFPAADIQRIRKVAATKCRELIEQAREPRPGRSKINVVEDLSEPVVVKIAATYFGITAIDFGIPGIDNEREMARTLRHLAGIVMVKPPAESKRWIEARECIAKFTKSLVELIEAKGRTIDAASTDPAPADDLLTRLVKRLFAKRQRSWFDEDLIRRCVTGLATTGGATIVRAVTHAVDRLVAHPAALLKAQALAARLEQESIVADRASTESERQAAESRVEETRRRLHQIIYEALRFRPMLALLVRYSPRETMIGKGTRRARMVPAGGSVIAAPLAAMFDPEAIEKPWRFSSTRPLEDYIHFGHGPRTCFGKHVADVLIVEIIRTLLLLPDLERVAGQRGRVLYDGPVVRSLTLTFDRNGQGRTPKMGASPA